MAGWQSSSLVIRDPTRAGFETCQLCYQADEQELNKAKEELVNGDSTAEERVNNIQRRMEASWWRTAVWYARRKHISQCTLQTEENRIRAQELLDRNAESNRKAEQKRKGKEKEKEQLQKMQLEGGIGLPTSGILPQDGNMNGQQASSSNSSALYYYKDYVAPSVLEENGINSNQAGSIAAAASSPSLQSGNAAAIMGDRDYATTISNTAGSKKNKNKPVKIKLTPAPDEDRNNNPTTSSPSALLHGNTSLSLPSTSTRHLSASLTTTDDDASDDGHSNLGDNDNDEDEEDDGNTSMNEVNGGPDGGLDSSGYPLKLPFWVSANLVARHPSSKDKETCLACMQELKTQRDELDGELDQESEDWKARSLALEEKIKDAYWLTNGNGRFRHMSECIHQSQDTREKAKVRLDRYLAMARQRMKARHQREKLEKKKRLATGGGIGLTVNTSIGKSAAGNAGGGASGRQSSAERMTPEPSSKSSKKVNPKKVAAMAMNEDLRALSILPGNKKREATVKGKASVMNTYENDFTDDENDLADLPPPMLHDSGSERSPSVPPEPIRTPHSVSFRVTNEPYIYIKDSLHPSILNRDEHADFFAASACLYAAQGDSSKITAQTFFDTPSDHSTSGIGSRKRSPHHSYYRREESKRRRATPDVPKRALAPPRTVMKRTTEATSST